MAIEKAFRKYDALRSQIMERFQQATLTRLPVSSEQHDQEYAQPVNPRNI